LAKIVGYACSIKLQWLNKAFQLLDDNLDEASYKAELNEYLSFEVDSPTRLRKTREILMNTWYRETETNKFVRTDAIHLLKKYPDYAPAIHLSMIYLAYPVVADICNFMGHMFEYQDEITNAVLKQKLFDAWGERGTLDTTSRRVTLTLKELGILEAPSKLRYTLKKQNISQPEVVNFIIKVAMIIEGSTYKTFSELREFYIMFPFEYSVSKEQLMMDNSFVLNHFGGELTVALNN
jgi:hypothetical protein